MALAEKVYLAIKSSQSFSQHFGLRDQITRAVISDPSTIAEGNERGTNREAVHFFHNSKGSSAEVITQLNLAHRLGYLDTSSLAELENLAEKVRASLKKLIKARGGTNPIKTLGWVTITLIRPI